MGGANHDVGAVTRIPPSRGRPSFSSRCQFSGANPLIAVMTWACISQNVFVVISVVVNISEGRTPSSTRRRP
jgi:hypothetical protein